MLCWLALFFLKSHPLCPENVVFLEGDLEGCFLSQSLSATSAGGCCSFARWQPCPRPVRRRRAQPGLASGLEPALGFLAAIWHVWSISVLTPFPFLEHFPGWEIRSEAAPSGSAASRELCQPGAGRVRIGRFRSSSPWTSSPQLGLGTAAMALTAWGVSASPFPPGNTARTPVFSVIWLFQSMTAVTSWGTREKHVKGRWDTFFCLEEAVEHSTPLNKYQEGGNKTQKVSNVSHASINSPPRWHHFGGFCRHRKFGHCTWMSLSSYERSTHNREKPGVEWRQWQRMWSRRKGSWTAVSMLPCRSQNWQHVRHEEYGTQNS